MNSYLLPAVCTHSMANWVFDDTVYSLWAFTVGWHFPFIMQVFTNCLSLMKSFCFDSLLIWTIKLITVPKRKGNLTLNCSNLLSIIHTQIKQADFSQLYWCLEVAYRQHTSHTPLSLAHCTHHLLLSMPYHLNISYFTESWLQSKL